MQQINADFIVPFIDATRSAFDIMLHMKLRQKEVYIKKNHVMFGDITGIIGISGSVCGTSAVTLPGPFAIKCIGDMMDEKIDNGLSDMVVHDGVGEIINLIAGQAKVTLGNRDLPIACTLPTIISGRGHELYHKQGTVIVSTIFETEDGEEFAVDVSTQGS